MTQLSDTNIWDACLKGDRRAFAELYRRYYPLLYNYGCKFCANKELVKDCIQNFFAKLIQNYQKLSTTQSVRGYLLLAFRNRLYDDLKHENSRSDMFLPCIDDLLSFDKGLIPFPPEDETSDDFIIMRLAFLELSSRQQEVLYLYYMLGASHSDIADILDINYQSSKNLLCRSLLKLKELFFIKLKEYKDQADYKEEDLDVFSHLAENFKWFHVELAK
ncbi:RNA polymerase sigma factor [Parabacteroides timonensis]|uniref:RNA polymerase sigma factor n=1 Tax=Parabacteroides timonensis TaxID=1871013 RepID=UPI00094E2EEB|nr:sigma-70 family RNA polymerase sigma factor [Parabacteroides timonensis]